ncbi:MAG TPA: nitroreductase [Sphingobium sp.]|uniref:nitroreductase n=1 Tax=Sphingobium sp. TaxID=1912891 RepID=UPI002ED4A961
MPLQDEDALGWQPGMDFDRLMTTRRSVRGFTDRPVSRALVDEILAVAKYVPSSMNTQPWHVYALSGVPLEELRRRNSQMMAAGEEPVSDIVTHTPYVGVHRDRQVDVAKRLFGAMGIAREDKAGRDDWVMRGFRQFDAPVSIILTYDRVLDPGMNSFFDLGALCCGIVLAAWDRGLGCVVNSQGIQRSDVVRDIAGIPEDRVIVNCVAMGWPDDDFAANHVRSAREPNEAFAHFVGFES